MRFRLSSAVLLASSASLLGGVLSSPLPMDGHTTEVGNAAHVKAEQHATTHGELPDALKGVDIEPAPADSKDHISPAAPKQDASRDDMSAKEGQADGHTVRFTEPGNNVPAFHPQEPPLLQPEPRHDFSFGPQGAYVNPHLSPHHYLPQHGYPPPHPESYPPPHPNAFPPPHPNPPPPPPPPPPAELSRLGNMVKEQGLPPKGHEIKMLVNVYISDDGRYRIDQSEAVKVRPVKKTATIKPSSSTQRLWWNELEERRNRDWDSESEAFSHDQDSDTPLDSSDEASDADKGLEMKKSRARKGSVPVPEQQQKKDQDPGARKKAKKSEDQNAQ